MIATDHNFKVYNSNQEFLFYGIGTVFKKTDIVEAIIVPIKILVEKMDKITDLFKDMYIVEIYPLIGDLSKRIIKDVKILDIKPSPKIGRITLITSFMIIVEGLLQEYCDVI